MKKSKRFLGFENPILACELKSKNASMYIVAGICVQSVNQLVSSLINSIKMCDKIGQMEKP